MKPERERLTARCPGIDGGLLSNHLERLGDAYYGTFSETEIVRHLEHLAQLRPDHPVEIDVEEQQGRLVCTVFAFDYPSEFSVITGLLAGSGFEVESGEVFTYRKAAPAPRDGARRAPRPPERAPWLRRRRIVDRFVGRLPAGTDRRRWEREFRRRLEAALKRLESGGVRDAEAVRHAVNEKVAAALQSGRSESFGILYPVSIDVDNSGAYTALRVISQDTPAFLYALSNALALNGMVVERVRIRTVQGRIEDELDILDGRGRKITDSRRIDELKLSVLLTKQFTYFLGRSADPYRALARFERMLGSVLELPDERHRWLDRLAEPAVMRDLARVLGTSDFLWEDFVRTQYETLLPLLGTADPRRRRSFCTAALRERMDAALAGAEGFEGRMAALNAFKDREIFLIDLDHLLHARTKVGALARPLTRLAEVVVAEAVECVRRMLVARFGTPRTVGDLEARFGVFGLGKLGGEALGYASDIELLFVYSDSGKTDGARSIANEEFFDRLAAGTARGLEAKREGIFQVDLRLRPHGQSGPRACSVGGFCRYYGPGGAAQSYERLALTRLRAIAGNAELGRQIERLRDAYVYEGAALDLQELQALRERQVAEKAPDGGDNAKFSRGALVDVEYSVQILQVRHGALSAEVRSPRIQKALRALARAGAVSASEARQLEEAYDFLRRLINGLRMLRGNALDLFLPGADSPEYAHLARRMGYERGGSLEPERRLFVDFETHTALVRRFLERHFGGRFILHSGQGNVADLVLAREPSAGLAEGVLRRAGFGDAQRAAVNLRRLAGSGERRVLFARVAVLGVDILRRGPHADMGLNNWERFVAALRSPDAHFRLLASQPRRLEILLRLFASSQFLADVLERNPDFLDWVTDPATLRARRTARDIREDLAAFAVQAPAGTDWRDALRRFRCRELLRIGIRDVCLKSPVESTMDDLSALADAAVEFATDRVQSEVDGACARGVAGSGGSLCVVALGKLGGRELNYSSDIDLLGVYDEKRDRAGFGAPGHARIMERVRAALSERTAEGYVYRVDLRLRPHGGAGVLVPSVRGLEEYCGRQAHLWELQALLKARPVAGNVELGRELLARIRPRIARRRLQAEIGCELRRMREQAVRVRGKRAERDLKNGVGGIRDVEFLAQGLQMTHLADRPGLFEGNTLQAIAKLRGEGIVSRETAVELRNDYLFLRSIEHALQLFEDRQVHDLPEDENELTALARRVLDEEAVGQHLVSAVSEARQRVRGHFSDFFSE